MRGISITYLLTRLTKSKGLLFTSTPVLHNNYTTIKLYNDLMVDVRIAENKRDFKEKLDILLKNKVT